MIESHGITYPVNCEKNSGDAGLERALPERCPTQGRVIGGSSGSWYAIPENRTSRIFSIANSRPEIAQPAVWMTRRDAKS